ncbi:MAG: hydroxyacid dehydrogenase [Deltaproteobacteria bacterium]|nr:hydroxyacid dehydrogenase [Deltaproteobacteria bacterium]
MVDRVLIADALDAESIAELQSAGIDVAFRPDLTAESLPDALPGACVLVVRNTRVTSDAIKAARGLGLIVRAGSGVQNIDVEAASARGVFVSECPGKNAAAVAELTLGLMLAIDRRIPENVNDLRAGRWNRARYSGALGLKGRVLGLVGFGAVAREVALRARAFEMEVRAYARSLTEQGAKDAEVRRATSLEQLFRDADVVSLHLPLNHDTRQLVGRRLLGVMKPGAVLINTAHAELCEPTALEEAVRAGKLRLGSDRWAREPEAGSGELVDALARLEGVYGTHHIGAATRQAEDAIARETVRIVRHFITAREVLRPVNLLLSPASVGALVVRHLDRVGVLASVLAELKKAEVNVETMENVVFAGGEAACARLRVSSWPGDRLLKELRAIEHVIHVEVI